MSHSHSYCTQIILQQNESISEFVEHVNSSLILNNVVVLRALYVGYHKALSLLGFQIHIFKVQRATIQSKRVLIFKEVV